MSTENIRLRKTSNGILFELPREVFYNNVTSKQVTLPINHPVIEACNVDIEKLNQRNVIRQDINFSKFLDELFLSDARIIYSKQI